jgi:hypothetical protein
MSSLSHEQSCERVPDCAAYVLRALAEQEAEAHRAHLRECPVCRAEIAQLQPVADSLAVGVRPARAGESIRSRIVGGVRAAAELRRGADTPAATADTPAAAGPSSADSGWPPWMGRHSASSARRLHPGLTGVLALGLGIAIGALAFSSTISETSAAEVIRAIVVAPGHHATAELRKVGSHLELVVVGMPAPPVGRIYEVWLERGAAAPEPTDALFSVTRTGSGSIGVPGDIRGVSKVLVTDEPLGGSLKPTRTPVIVGSI